MWLEIKLVTVLIGVIFLCFFVGVTNMSEDTSDGHGVFPIVNDYSAKEIKLPNVQFNTKGDLIRITIASPYLA